MPKAAKWLILATLAAATITAAFVTAAWYVSTEAGARRLLAAVNTLYPGEIRGSAVGVDLLRQEVTIRDARILAPGNRLVLRADRAFVRTRLGRLSGSRLVFSRIDLVNPVFFLELGPDGRLTIEEAFVEDTPEESPVDVFIERLSCTNGTLVYKDESGSDVVRLDRTRLVMSASFARETELGITIPHAHAALSVSGKTIDLGTGRGSCSIVNDSVRGISWSSRIASTGYSLTGSVTAMSAHAKLDLHLVLEGDLADLRALPGIGEHDSGQIHASITASGPYEDPDIEFELATRGLLVDGYETGPASASGTVRGRVAAVAASGLRFASGKMDISGSVDLRRVFPDGYFEGMKEEDLVGYDLAVTATSLSLEKVPGMPGGIGGLLHVKARVKGTGVTKSARALEVSFEAQGSGVSAAPVMNREQMRASGRILLGRDSLAVQGLRLTGDTLSAEMSGTADLKDETLDAAVLMHVAHPERILARTGVRVSGSIDVSAKITGALRNPLADISAVAERAAIEGAAPGNVTMDATLEPSGRLVIRSCTVTAGPSSATAQGTIQVFSPFPHVTDDPGLELDVRLSGVDPSLFRRDLDIHGAIDGSARVSGTLSRPSATFDLSGRDMAVYGVPFDRARATGSFSDGALRLDVLDLVRKASVIRSSLVMTVLDSRGAPVDDPVIVLDVSGAGLSLADFTQKASGTVSLSGHVTGTIGHPAGTVTMEGTGIDIGFQRFESASLRARSDGDIVWIEPAVVTIAPGQTINARGFVTTAGAFEFSLGTPGIDLRSLDIVKPYETLAGTLFLHASGHGTLDNPVISGRVSAAGISFMNSPLEDMTLSFEIADKKIEMEGDWNFHLRARHDLVTGMFDAEALFAESDLAPLFTLAGRKTLTGRLTGSASLTGRTSSPRDSNISLHIASLDMFHDGVPVLQASGASATYRSGRIDIPLTRISLARGGLVDVQGSGEFPRSIDLMLDGAIPAETFGLLWEDMSDASGTVRISANVRAEGKEPRVTALATIEDLAWTIPANGQRLHGVNGRITIDGNRVYTDDIAGNLDSGTFELGGSVVLSRFRPVSGELLLQAKALPVAIPDTMDLAMDLEASWDLGPRASLLRADAVIVDGVYYRDMRVDLFSGVLGRILPRRRSADSLAGVRPITWEPLASTVLDVTVKRRGEVKVENNIAELDINPDLRITGRISQPIVNGRITVTDGVVTFQNNEFSVRRGVIDFLDPAKTRAAVDISATTTVRDWEITLSLEGELDELKLTLSSQPPEEPSDIVSLLIVGRTSRELTQEQSSVSVSPTGMIAELITSTYGSEIKKTTTLDILEFKASDFSTSQGGESVTLVVGKELSRRMTLKYEMTTRNAETLQRAVAEYKILENLLVNGYQGTDGIFGVDLLYRRKFR